MPADQGSHADEVTPAEPLSDVRTELENIRAVARRSRSADKSASLAAIGVMTTRALNALDRHLQIDGAKP